MILYNIKVVYILCCSEVNYCLISNINFIFIIIICNILYIIIFLLLFNRHNATLRNHNQLKWDHGEIRCGCVWN